MGKKQILKLCHESVLEKKKGITFQFSDPFYIYVHDGSNSTMGKP
jgi:hypothetical protein